MNLRAAEESNKQDKTRYHNLTFTEDELKLIWHRLNMSQKVFNSVYDTLSLEVKQHYKETVKNVIKANKDAFDDPNDYNSDVNDPTGLIWIRLEEILNVLG